MAIAWKSAWKFFFLENLAWKIQYSCLENPMDGGAWQTTVHGVSESWTRLSNFTFTFHFHSLEKEMATHSSILAWRSQGRGSLVGCRLWGRRVRDRKSTRLNSSHTDSSRMPSSA